MQHIPLTKILLLRREICLSHLLLGTQRNLWLSIKVYRMLQANKSEDPYSHMQRIIV